MRTLVIDNYDSFTWNLVHYIAEVNGHEPVVVRNDAFTWEQLKHQHGPFDNIVISPGPGSVENDGDFHISRTIIEQADVPLLGVCLGHQGIAHCYGGTVMHAHTPVHGRSSQVWHNGDALFANIPSPLSVVRYHSLIVAPSLPDELQVIARAEDQQVMALRHRQRPLWGVQFHPESILTEHGYQLIRNFRELTHQFHGQRIYSVPEKLPEKPQPTVKQQKQVYWCAVECQLSSEDLFVGLFAQSEHAFWLDSALIEPGLSRFSFLGEHKGKSTQYLECKLGDSTSAQTQAHKFLAELEQALNVETYGGEGLPFEFHGGWVGFLTYEMKALAGAVSRHQNQHADAVWFCCENFIAVDHAEQKVYALCVNDGDAQAAQVWLDAIAERIRHLYPAKPVNLGSSQRPLSLLWDQSRREYLNSIERCQQAIVDGVSYEICLTNQLRVAHQVQGLDLYRVLRQSNPAPFAAYLRHHQFEVLSASPERFLSVSRNGKIEAKPIKGTSLRDENPVRDAQLARSLQQSEKERAENLMIVDLMRNDLGRVAERGSVSVPRLMYVESYSTVHQLISTVTAQLSPESNLIDVIRASFPGGSITGAPKIRTMKIIDELEDRARGVYCGSIGYLGYNRVADLNIAIRTLSVDEQEMSLGAGGAITQLSNATDEYAEIVLKAQALVRAISLYVHGREVDYLSQYVDVMDNVTECSVA